ncbi:zinc finger protein CONSTANS-LIKE 2-like [Senna tora]|uniref:Zinc finger protein CONSTANS-LIKE 2-like n=1 Tax=Senna tora TaxID=362788 RepID=A0A834W4T3_9FABA|nr:zinc finger protein CONSTANS-LIKE 2-like [Senna tora]
MKKCELCKIPARTYCESDEASLCWECDAKVHGANFLVARHSRTLLCHACQSPTPWKASGVHLGNTVSLCRACDDQEEGEESEGGNDTDSDGADDGDSQIVPSSSTTTPPPPSSSSSSDESVSESVTTVSLKRRRADADAGDHNSQDGASATDGG